MEIEIKMNNGERYYCDVDYANENEMINDIMCNKIFTAKNDEKTTFLLVENICSIEVKN